MWRTNRKLSAKTICSRSQYLNAMSLRNKGKNPPKTWHGIWEMHLELQIIGLLFTDASSEMLSVEGWLPRSHCSGSETSHKNWDENQWQQVGCEILRFKYWINQYVEGSSGKRYKKKSLQPCLKQWRLCRGLGLLFRQCCWRSCQNWLNYEHRKALSSFHPPCSPRWKESDSISLFFSKAVISNTRPMQ